MSEFPQEGVARGADTTVPTSLIAGGAVILFLLLVTVGWVGFLGSDDVTYALGGYGWLESFPYVGGHGTIRETIAIPIALSFRLLGENEVALVLPSLIYATALLVTIVFTVATIAGRAAATAVAVLVATSPLMTVQSSIAGVDVIEAFFLFGSLFAFLAALKAGGRFGLLVAAGALAGFAFLTRETAVFLILLYAVLFLAGYRMPRRRYWIMAIGFLCVWGTEVAYLTIMTGDPFYRLRISLNHDPTIDRTIDAAGNLLVSPLIDPLLLLLVNQEFVLLFWVVLPAAVWLWRQRRLIPPGTNELLVVTGGMALVWMLAAGAATSLLPLNPRYFLICAISACILLGVAVARAIQLGGIIRVSAASTMLAVLVGNSAGILVENRDYMFGERTLAAVATSSEETIYTDPMTYHRAKLLLRWADAEDRVVAAPPPPGACFLYNSLRAGTPNRFVSPDRVIEYQPQPSWSVMQHWDPGLKWSGSILRMIGIEGMLSEHLREMLMSGHAGVVLYRAAASGEKPPQ